MARGHKGDSNPFNPTPKIVEEHEKRFTPTVHGGMRREDFKGFGDDINTVAHEGVIRTSRDQEDKQEENDTVALEKVRERIDSMKDNG